MKFIPLPIRSIHKFSCNLMMPPLILNSSLKKTLLPNIQYLINTKCHKGRLYSSDYYAAQFKCQKNKRAMQAPYLHGLHFIVIHFISRNGQADSSQQSHKNDKNFTNYYYISDTFHSFKRNYAQRFPQG